MPIWYIDGMRESTARKIAKYAFRDSLVNLVLKPDEGVFEVILTEDVDQEVIDDFLEWWGGNWKIYKIKKTADAADEIAKVKTQKFRKV